MKKRNVTKLLAAIMAVAFLIAGCGKKDDAQESVMELEAEVSAIRFRVLVS